MTGKMIPCNAFSFTAMSCVPQNWSPLRKSSRWGTYQDRVDSQSEVWSTTWARSCFGFGFSFTKPKHLRPKLRLRLQLRSFQFHVGLGELQLRTNVMFQHDSVHFASQLNLSISPSQICMPPSKGYIIVICIMKRDVHSRCIHIHEH